MTCYKTYQIQIEKLDKQSNECKTIKYMEGLEKQFKQLSGCKQDIKLHSRMVFQKVKLSN
ncbi:unnamed protein product [Paramecium primaurelia]|uniref:Uncharacterized protein n=1 Tax=Paramecium primaurelia TaxID=5886 RepID=A0A8S1QHR1_PARPR|nr:unnamed protein product [Paramecium primaurelia]